MDMEDFNSDDDTVDVINFLEFGIPRSINERSNYFLTMDEVKFRKRFRLTKSAVMDVLTLIEHRLEFNDDGNNSVSPINQLLTCLRLFSTGGHLDAVADFAGMHLSTVSRIAIKVSEAIAELAPAYIKFPSNYDEIRKIQQDFYNTAQFPRVIGAVDGSHFKVQSPGGNDPEVFRNRKGYFSVNGQFICSSELRILDLIARWPGSTHDATIFNNSRIKRAFETNAYRNCLLLGDSGYASKPYLVTPVSDPSTPTEHAYNESHIRTRNVIERLFGVLKRRFPILAYGCRLRLETFLTIIVATSVLHNIEAPPIPEELDGHVLEQLINDGRIPNTETISYPREAAGSEIRRRLINDYFQHRL